MPSMQMARMEGTTAYSPSKGMVDVSAHGDEAETDKAKKTIDIQRIVEEEGVKCLVVCC